MTPDLDIAGMSNWLRASTAKLLGLDESKLSVAEKIRVDRASALRLLLDDMQAAQLNGGAIDVGEFIKASEELERLAGGNPETTSTHDFSGAREELARFFVQRAERIEAREMKESERLREELTKLREENTKLRSDLKVQAPQAPQKQPDNVVVFDGTARANAAKPPASYLKEGQPREPWESHYGGRGTVEVACWSPPDERRR